MFSLLRAGAPAPALSFESRAGAWCGARRWRRCGATRLSAVACSRADCCALARVDGGSAVAARTSIARRDLLARDTAAHRAMLIVGRFLTGRRARQRTACLGISGLAHLSNDNIASTDRLIASAAYCRVCYSTTTALVASIVSHAAADAPCCNASVLSLSEPSVLNLRCTRPARPPRLPSTRMKPIARRQNP